MILGALVLRPLPVEVAERVEGFARAPLPVDELRDRFGVVDKSPAAHEAGSVGPWEPGGISEYQHRTAQELATAEGRQYESYGATP